MTTSNLSGGTAARRPANGSNQWISERYLLLFIHTVSSRTISRSDRMIVNCNVHPFFQLLLLVRGRWSSVCDGWRAYSMGDAAVTESRLPSSLRCSGR